MTPEDFVKNMIAGGYIHPSYNLQVILNDKMVDPKLIIELVLIPKAWQAVGKVRGWKKSRVPMNTDDIYSEIGWHDIPTWLYNMHRMIDALAEGRSIEDFLKTL